MEQGGRRSVLLSRFVCYLLSSVGMVSPSFLGFVICADMLRSLVFLSGLTTSLLSGLAWARVLPLTYSIGSMAVARLANTSVTCAPLELLGIKAPSEADLWSIATAIHPKCGRTGLRSEVDKICQFCPMSKTDDVLAAREFSCAQRGGQLGYPKRRHGSPHEWNN